MKIGIDLGGSHVGIALISNENKIIEKVEIPIEKNINTELEILNIIDSYKYAIASGSSTACSEGLTTFENMNKFLEKVEIKKIN